MVNTDNIDRFGHCVICHNNLLVKRIVVWLAGFDGGGFEGGCSEVVD